ncbi:MAG: hypothetical protein GY822_16180 [Deltaproteobacteria bacterium]|nr:hypothetical protein [Deltaproteobacteria bacterium]
MTISLLSLIFSFSQTKPLTPVKLAFEAGHRLYFDVTALMHHFIFRKALPKGLMELSPAIGTRLEAVVNRADFASERSKTNLRIWPALRLMTRLFSRIFVRVF